MSDAYGFFVFSKSVDCEIDAGGLAKALNCFSWDSCGGRWLHNSEYGTIYHAESLVKYATIYPLKIEKVHCYSPEDGEEHWKSVEEMTPEDWDYFDIDEFEEEEAEPELSDIKEALIKYIKKGWIEISFSLSHKNLYVAAGSLKIEAGGLATRLYFCSGLSSGPEYREETA